MALTYDSIATQTLSSAASSVDFTSIPSTYTDLILIGQFGLTSGVIATGIRFNNDTGTNYSFTELYGSGTSAASARGSGQNNITIGNSLVPANNLSSNMILQVNNYANTTTNKTAINRLNVNNATYNGTSATVGLWRSTAAINRITIMLSSSTIISGSTFTLYGIKAA